MGDVSEVIQITFICDRQELLLLFPKLPTVLAAYSVVPIEIIIRSEIGLYRLEVNQTVFELLQQKETGLHTLTSRNCITFRLTLSHVLKYRLLLF